MASLYARDRMEPPFPCEREDYESDFDAVLLAFEAGEIEQVAHELRTDDVYRKSTLALTPDEAMHLGRLLAQRGLELVDDGHWWGVYGKEAA